MKCFSLSLCRFLDAVVVFFSSCYGCKLESNFICFIGLACHEPAGPTLTLALPPSYLYSFSSRCRSPTLLPILLLPFYPYFYPCPCPYMCADAYRYRDPQASTAFEAMAAAADINDGNPGVLSDVISHQLGPMPRLLDGLVSGCAAVVPTPSVSTVPTSVGVGGGMGMSIGGGNNASSVGGVGGLMPLSNKRTKDEFDDGGGRPGKKVARGERSSNGSGSSSGEAATGLGMGIGGAGGDGSPSGGGGNAQGGAGVTGGSENGGGASLSPSAVAPPASNLLERPASADFYHAGGEELMALLRAKVGRLFSLEAEYTHLRRGVSENGSPAARGAEGKKIEGLVGGGVGVEVGGVKATGGLRRVLGRLKAVRAGQFVVNVKFDVAGHNEFRPCDVSVLSWAEAHEPDGTGSASGGIGGGGVGGGGVAKVEGGQAGGGFMDSLDGSKPWRTSVNTAFVRVSGHAFQVCILCLVILLHATIVYLYATRPRIHQAPATSYRAILRLV